MDQDFLKPTVLYCFYLVVIGLVPFLLPLQFCQLPLAVPALAQGKVHFNHILPCDLRSKWNWVVKIILTLCDRLRSTHCREFFYLLYLQFKGSNTNHELFYQIQTRPII